MIVTDRHILYGISAIAVAVLGFQLSSNREIGEVNVRVDHIQKTQDEIEGKSNALEDRIRNMATVQTDNRRSIVNNRMLIDSNSARLESIETKLWRELLLRRKKHNDEKTP